MNRINNKKGVSEVIAYVLLVTFLIVISIIVYNWMKTYVPREELKCPDEVSILVKDYNCTSNELTLVLENNGNFNIGGYYIYVANNPQAELATIDISHNVTSGETFLTPTGIKINGEGNSWFPNQDETQVFDVSSVDPMIYLIEIVPMRWQEQGRKNRLVTCRDAKMRKSITCS